MKKRSVAIFGATERGIAAWCRKPVTTTERTDSPRVVALIVASALFCRSLVWFHRSRTVVSSLQLLGSVGFIIVVFCEGLNVLRWMHWAAKTAPVITSTSLARLAALFALQSAYNVNAGCPNSDIPIYSFVTGKLCHAGVIRKEVERNHQRLTVSRDGGRLVWAGSIAWSDRRLTENVR